MYAVAGAARPRHVPRARPRDLRRDGAGRHHRRRASSTTCTTRRAACRTTTRTRWPRRCAQAAGDAGIRLTLLDTCYLAGGLTGDGHLPLDAVQQRFCDGDVDAWAAGSARPATGRRPCGSVPPSTRSAPCRRAPARPWWRPRRGPAAARAPVRAAGREPRGLEHYGLHADRAARPARACSDRRPRPSTRTHLTGADIAAARQLPGPPSASAPRPNATSPTASARPAGSVPRASPLSLGSDQHAIIDLFEEARGARDARASGVVAARALLTHRDAHRTTASPQPGLVRRRPAGDRRPRRFRRRTHRQRAHRRRGAGAAASHRHRGRRGHRRRRRAHRRRPGRAPRLGDGRRRCSARLRRAAGGR